jgi:hypothetical protein
MADAFVDSVGVNIHLHAKNTPYSNFPRVEQALKESGIRHVRDGLIDTTWTPYYERHNQLGKLGIKATFITSPGQSEQLLLDYPKKMRDTFEAYEAPNEYDVSGGANWATTLTTFLSFLYKTVKGNPQTSQFPILGPSLVQPKSFLQLGSRCFFDYSNLHDYFAGRNPGTPGWGANGYGSIGWNLSTVNTVCDGKPVMTTETGYQTNTEMANGIPEDVAAKYVARVLLEQWLHGIQRTYLYEFIDLPGGFNPSDSWFGLLHADYSLKPSYNAVCNLLGLLSDPGPSFIADELDFRLAGDLSNLHHVLFQKRDRAFFLALWIEQPSYDVSSKQATPVAHRQVVLQMNKPAQLLLHWLDSSGNLHTSSAGAATECRFQLGDSVTIVEIQGTAPHSGRPSVLHPAVMK